MAVEARMLIVGLLIVKSMATPAAAETCHQSGVSSIDGACMIDGGTVTGCTPDCSDGFEINGAVTQTADMAMSVPSGDAIRIRSGGSWNTNGFDLTYDTGGLIVLNGGSFAMNGPGFREWALTATPSIQDIPSPWPAGRYIPCPYESLSGKGGAETDCNEGDNNIVRFAYDPGRADANVPASLAAVRIDDVVCGYYDPITMGATAAAWTNSCFEVSDVDPTCSGPNDCYLEIEMDQSWLGQPSRDYPLARRRVIETRIGGGYTGNIAFGGEPDVSVSEGQRRLCVLGTSATMLEGTPSAVAKNEDLVGRFLRFSDSASDSLPLDWSYVINGLEYNATSCDGLPSCDGDCHLVSISDPRGVAEDHSTGDRVWIDFGFMSSDFFAIIAEPPVLTALHEAGGFGGQVGVEGAISLRNAVAVDIGTFDFKGATIDDLEWLFVSDPTPSINSPYDTHVHVFYLEDNVLNLDSIHHINVVGGPGFATCDNTLNTGPGTGTESCNSGLHVFMSRGQTYRFRDVSMSYNDDDCFAGIRGGGGVLDIERFYCGPSGDAPSSSNFIDLFDQQNHVVMGDDMICANCSNTAGDQAVSIFKLILETTPRSTLNRVSVIGAQGDFNQNLHRERAQFTNVFLSGHRTATGGSRAGPANIEFFVIEDTRPDLDLAPARSYWQAASLALLRNGIVRNSSLSGNRSVLEHPNEGAVDNVLFLNLDKSFEGETDNSLVQLRVDDTPAIATYRNLTFAYQSGFAPSRLDTIIDANNLDGKTYTVHDVLIANTPVARGVAATDISQLANSQGWCLYDAGSIEDSENFPPDTVRDQNPGFSSPATGDFRTRYGGPCGSSGIKRGIESPGLRENGYYLSALHLSPKILNRMDGVAWRFSGIAAGGSVEFTVDGVELIVLTAAGQSAVEVAANIAAAINTNAALAAAGVDAMVRGSVVSTEGLITDVLLNDDGLNRPLGPVVALPPWALGLLWLALMGATYALFTNRVGFLRE